MKSKNPFLNIKPSRLIISLVCAILLWFYVSGVDSTSFETTYDDIKITLKDKDVLRVSYDLSVVNEGDFTSSVTLSGKKSKLQKIDNDDISVYVDLSNISEAGQYELPIRVSAPAGTGIVSSNPQYITVNIDKTIASIFDITTDIVYNNLSSNYKLGDSYITDDKSNIIKSVTITGPKNDIDKISKVCAKVDFGTLTTSAEAKTPIMLVDEFGDEIINSNLKLNISSVKVIQPVYIEKPVSIKAGQMYNTFDDSQITIKTSPSVITVKGDPKILEELDEITIDPINERTIGEALTTTVSALIKLPEGLELSSTQNTVNITASVHDVDKATVSLSTNDIAMKNIPDGMVCTFDKSVLNVIAISAKKKNLTSKDLVAEADLSGCTSKGNFEVPVNIAMKDSIGYAYVIPGNYTVNVNVK